MQQTYTNVELLLKQSLIPWKPFLALKVPKTYLKTFTRQIQTSMNTLFNNWREQSIKIILGDINFAYVRVLFILVNLDANEFGNFI